MVLRGALGALLVLLGGLVTSVLPESSAVGQLPVIAALRGTMPGRMAGLTVVVAGLGLLGAAWLELVRYAGSAGRASAGARLATVRRATAWWCSPLLLAPAMFSRDGWSYAAQGELTRLGLSPYVWAPSVLQGPIVEAVDPRWMHTLTPYGPLPLLWGSFAAGLTDSPWLLVVAHRLLALTGLALLGFAVPRFAAWAGRDPATASALVLASPLTIAHGVAGLHNDLAMVGLMAVALVVAVERSWVVGAVLGGAAAAVKVPGGLVCLGVVLVSLSVLATRQDRVRRLVNVAAVSVGTLAVVGLVAGLGMGWVHALGVPGEVRTPLSLTTQAGQLVGIGFGSTGLTTAEDVAVRAARGVGSFISLAVAARAALRAPTGVPAGAVRTVALVITAVVLLSPVVHHWYALWAVPFLAACHLGPRASAMLRNLCLLLGLVAPLDSSLEGAYVPVVVTALLVGGVAITLTVRHRSRVARAQGAAATGETAAPRFATPW